MAIAFTVAFKNFPEVAARVRAVAEAGKDLRPVYEAFGPHMIRSVDQNFQEGGRPARWTPSKKSGGKTLVDTGILKNSINFRVSARGLVIGTNVKYGAIHQLGGTIPAHTVRPKRAKTLAFMVGGRMVFASKVEIPAMTLPARPFLAVQEGDWEVMGKIAGDYLAGKWVA